MIRRVILAVGGVVVAGGLATAQGAVEVREVGRLFGERVKTIIDGPVVVVGDIDGDGLADFGVRVAETGPDGCDHVLLVSSATRKPVRTLGRGLDDFVAFAGVGDVDGDGLADVALARLALSRDENVASLEVRSGADDAVLSRRTLAEGALELRASAFESRPGPQAHRLLTGARWAANGNADLFRGDSRPAFDAIGTLMLYDLSGTLHDASDETPDIEMSAPEHFAYTAAWVSDLDGDDIADVLTVAALPYVATDASTQFSRGLEARSGHDGHVLWQHDLGRHTPLPGLALAGLGDLDGDGTSDVAVGLPLNGPDEAGRVLVLSGKHGREIRSLEGQSPGDEFGSALQELGDLDADGVPDLAIGAPRRQNRAAHLFRDALPGVITLISGADGSVIAQLPGTAGDRLHGHSIAAITLPDNRRLLASADPKAVHTEARTGALVIYELTPAQPEEAPLPR